MSDDPICEFCKKPASDHLIVYRNMSNEFVLSEGIDGACGNTESFVHIWAELAAANARIEELEATIRHMSEALKETR